MSELFNSPVLVVEQPRKFLPAPADYRVLRGDGAPLATIRDIDLSPLGKVLRLFQNSPAKLQISDPAGQSRLIVHRRGIPATARVLQPDGLMLGSVWEDFWRAGSRFQLVDANEAELGKVTGNWRECEFAIADTHGTQVAQVSRRFAVLTREFLTTPDRYGVEIQAQLPEPLRSLVIASAVTINLLVSRRRGH